MQVFGRQVRLFGARLLGRHAEFPDQFFQGPDRHPLLDRPFGEQLFLPVAVDRKQHLGVAHGKHPFGHLLAETVGQLQQAQGIRHRGPRLADLPSHGFLRHAKFFLEQRIALGLLDRVEVFALEIFDQCDLQRLFVSGLDDDHRHLLQQGGPGGAQSALPGDQLELAAHLAHQQRLEHAVHLDRFHQFGEGFRLEIATGLPRAGHHLGHCHPLHAGFRRLGCGNLP